jgi:hypothetical protein
MAGQWVSWQEQDLLQLLGRAVVSQWDGMPQAIRNDLLKDARRIDAGRIDGGRRSAETEQEIKALLQAHQDGAMEVFRRSF